MAPGTQPSTQSALPFAPTARRTQAATILLRAATTPCTTPAGSRARSEAPPSPHGPVTAGGPLSRGLSWMTLSSVSVFWGQRENPGGTGAYGQACIWASVRLPQGGVGGRWVEGRRGVYMLLFVSSPSPGSLIWLWPGHSRRSRRFLLGN